MTSWELRDRIFNHEHKAGSLQQSSKPDPRNVLLLAKLHLLKVLQPPQIVPPVGEHAFKHVSLWEDLSKPAQLIKRQMLGPTSVYQQSYMEVAGEDRRTSC